MDAKNGLLDSSEDEAFIAIANELLDKCNLPGRVSRLEECNDSFFVGVHKGLLGDDLPGIIENPITIEQHIINCQIVIDLVATDVLNVDLSHISGKGIVEGDKVSIRNFLEIFAGLLEYFMECVDESDAGSIDEQDSNLLSSEHDVISGVLREEFGPSYQALYEPRSQTTRPNQFTDEAGHPSAEGGQNFGGDLLRRPPHGAPDPALMRTRNSTGFEADTSKLSDSRDTVSDSTGELIRLGETTSERVSSMGTARKKTRNPLPDSTSSSSASSPIASQEQHKFFQSGNGEGRSTENASRRLASLRDSSHSQATGAFGSRSRRPEPSLLSRDGTSMEDELTQYTLTPTATGDSSAAKDKSDHRSPENQDKPLSSFLSASSSSAAWPEQISPLEPTKDSSSGAVGGFDALGLRPRERPAKTVVTDSGSQDGSDQSAPVYHHYHHHFHHTQPHSRVPSEFQPSAEVSAAATFGVAVPTSHLSRSEPVATRPLGGVTSAQADSLIRTAPADLAHQHTEAAYPRSTAVSRTDFTHPSPAVVTASSTGVTVSSIDLTRPTTAGLSVSRAEITRPPHAGLAVSSTDFTRPPPAGVAGTTSTLTDSVFLSESGSSRPPFVRPATAGMTSESFVGTDSLRDRLGRSLITTTAPSTAGSSLSVSAPMPMPSTSYRPRGTLERSLDARAAVLQQADKLVDRLNNIRRGQPLASTYPGRATADSVQARITDLEPSDATPSSAAEGRLPKFPRPEADDSGSESDRELDDEELAQNSDSAIDYGRRAPSAAARVTQKMSTSRAGGRRGRSRKSPRIPSPRGYKDSESKDEDSSPERPARRGVTFRDTVETFPVSGRMDRLRRLLYEEAEEQRKQHTKVMRQTYRDQLKEIQQEQEREKALQQKRKMALPSNVPKKRPKKKSPVKKRGRLEAVYRSQVRKSRPVRRPEVTARGRKRSASASPVLTRGRSGSPDHPDLLLPAMLEEFPFLHVSPQTAHSMWQKQTRHLSSALKSGTEARRTKTQRMIEEAERRQEALVGILKKDLEHNLRMREKQERQQQQRTVKSKLREKRQISARARRYYDEYEVRMRARMLKRRTREEQIFRKLFDDGLDIQKQRIRELREYAKEKREALAQRQQNEIESLENFYRDQFAMLSEGIARERFEMEVREKAQEKVLRQMRKELRHKLERDVKEFQDNLQRDEDSAYFRQLEADRLRGKFQLATRNAFY